MCQRMYPIGFGGDGIKSACSLFLMVFLNFSCSEYVLKAVISIRCVCGFLC